jgi:hypothetical protein
LPSNTTTPHNLASEGSVQKFFVLPLDRVGFDAPNSYWNSESINSHFLFLAFRWFLFEFYPLYNTEYQRKLKFSNEANPELNAHSDFSTRTKDAIRGTKLAFDHGRRSFDGSQPSGDAIFGGRRDASQT